MTEAELGKLNKVSGMAMQFYLTSKCFRRDPYDLILDIADRDGISYDSVLPYLAELAGVGLIKEPAVANTPIKRSRRVANTRFTKSDEKFLRAIGSNGAPDVRESMVEL